PGSRGLQQQAHRRRARVPEGAPGRSGGAAAVARLSARGALSVARSPAQEHAPAHHRRRLLRARAGPCSGTRDRRAGAPGAVAADGDWTMGRPATRRAASDQWRAALSLAARARAFAGRTAQAAESRADSAGLAGAAAMAAARRIR